MHNNFSEAFDVIVVGSGPAGGECARELARRGRKVLLMEKSTGIGRPNFSSGGTPLETFKDFDLPFEIGRGTWSKVLIAARGGAKTWDYGETRGYVFAFDELKQFLAAETVKHGGKVMISTAAEEPTLEGDSVVGVKCKGVFGEGVIRGKVVVDASGPVGVLASKIGLREAEPEAAAIGIELIVEGVPPEFRNVLAFYFSDVYVPHGYGWIFPFGEHQCKVGVAVYGASKHGIPEDNHGTAGMMALLKKFMEKFPQFGDAEPVDLHGGNIYITGGIKNHSSNGFLVIGDAAMQINPLAGEGIRHALHSGRMAAEIIDRKLSANDVSRRALAEYDDRWAAYIGKKWRLSYLIAEKLYGDLTEDQWQYLMRILAGLSASELFKLGFDFEFLKVIKFKDVLRALKIKGSLQSYLRRREKAANRSHVATTHQKQG